MSEMFEGQPTVKCEKCERRQFEKPNRRYCVACKAALYPHVVPESVVKAMEQPAETRKPFFAPIDVQKGQLSKIVIHKLCEARKKKRWSQKEMGKRSKMFRTNITRLEKSARVPTLMVLQRLARTLDLDFVELLLQSEAELGRPLNWTPNFVEEIAEYVPKLTGNDKYLILNAAQKLSVGQTPLPEWINLLN